MGTVPGCGLRQGLCPLTVSLGVRCAAWEQGAPPDGHGGETGGLQGIQRQGTEEGTGREEGLESCAPQTPTTRIKMDLRLPGGPTPTVHTRPPPSLLTISPADQPGRREQVARVPV